MKNLFLIAFAMFCCSCATVVRGTNDTARFESTPEGASVTVESVSEDKMGPFDCIAPCEMELKRKRTWRVDYALDGYKPVSGLLKPEVTGGGVAAGAGNALIGGLIGIGIDAGTGANLDLRPNPMIALLEPVDSPNPSQILDAEIILDDEMEGAIDEAADITGDAEGLDETDESPAANLAAPDEAEETPATDTQELLPEEADEAESDEGIVGVSFEANESANSISKPTTIEALDHSQAFRYKPGEVAPTDEESNDLNERQIEMLRDDQH